MSSAGYFDGGEPFVAGIAIHQGLGAAAAARPAVGKVHAEFVGVNEIGKVHRSVAWNPLRMHSLQAGLANGHVGMDAAYGRKNRLLLWHHAMAEGDDRRFWEAKDRTGCIKVVMTVDDVGLH